MLPEVSVVVIVYNDADRLPTAVESVLSQSLRNVEVVIVDDCSTDGSYDVARSLASRDPQRVGAHQLPSNSGGCGGPRNHGITKARGRYVMFLDSDDVLEHDACRNMLEAADRTGADLVSGLCVRVYTDSRNGKTSEWYPWLYDRTRTVDSITELPDLFVFDTLSTNKCYRREFLLENNLEFPVGIHYEDLLFSAQAYLAAGRITLIPNWVYSWNVVEKTANASISNRRSEINNFVHRLEIHRRIDALLDERGLSALRHHKHVKFLKHDLMLYMRDLPFLNEEYRDHFSEMVREYLDGMPPELYDLLLPIHRICALLLVRDDWANLMPAIDTLLNRNKLSSPLVERDGRVFWCSEHLDDPLARSILDVTDEGYHSKALTKLFLRNTLTRYEHRDGVLLLGGRIVNPLGRISPDAQLSARIELGARRRSLQTFRFPVRQVRVDGDGIEWQAVVDLRRRFHPVGVVDNVWDIAVLLTVDGEETRTRLSTGGMQLEDSLPVLPRLTRFTADRLRPEVSVKGHLAFVVTAERPAARRTQELVGKGIKTPAGRVAISTIRAARKAKRELSSHESKVRLYHEMTRRLPVRKGTVVFESHMGKQYSDSPRAIYEELRRRNVPITPIWVYSQSTAGFPKDVELVKRWSWQYLRALAQAEYWVDNQGFPLDFGKRPETTYVQTWHGTALKRMGFDEPNQKLLDAAGRKKFQNAIDRFDHFLVRGDHDMRTLVRAFNVPAAKVLRSGYPRNDALVHQAQEDERFGAPQRDAQIQALAERLGVPEGRKVLLYAPTFRAAPDGEVKRFEFPFDVDRFADRFGDRYTLLIRTHYLNNVVLPPSVRGRVIDVSDEHDVTPLYRLADGLITDYSSVMFDYSLLNRPMVFYAYDWHEYAEDLRGTYFDLREQAPGPFVESEGELFDTLEDLATVATEWAGVRQRFAKEFGECDTGSAAEQVVDAVFGQEGTR